MVRVSRVRGTEHRTVLESHDSECEVQLLSLDIMKELKIPRFQSASRLTCATSLGEFVFASPQRARKVAG